MTVSFPRPSQADCIRELNATARGEQSATLVIKDARLVNVVSNEILPGTDVAIQGTRIAYVGKNADHTIGEKTKVIDAEDRYVTPGFLDGHCHIESSQIRPSQFARAVMPKGTTGGFFDAHEITNVLGLDGLKLMLEEARQTPMAAYMQVPSCVPSTDEAFETNGAVIGPEEVAEAFTWGADVNALGEVMNFPGVVYGDEKMLSEIEETLRAGRQADGHYTWPAEDDRRLSAYTAAGISGDHENSSAEDIIAQVRLGMYAKLRRGSAWHDVVETIKAYTEYGLNTRRMLLVTDDRSPESLVDEGHMDFVVRHAIAQGVPPVIAIQMATINPAERFGVSGDVGMIAPGRFADLLLLEGTLADVNVGMTVSAGEIVAEDGEMVTNVSEFPLPEKAVHSVQVGKEISADDFRITPPSGEGQKVTVRTIEVNENQVYTKEKHVSLPCGKSDILLQGDLCKMGVIERHGRNGNHGLGILKGIGFDKPAAMASTVAHDSHNLMVIGNDEHKMATAANKVVEMQGGIAVISEEGETILPLPIAGLMSNAPFEEVAEGSRAISHALNEAGCTMNYAFMTLSLLALVVIPELRLSDKGLVKITDDGFEKVSLMVET
ncbi:adenine deaminase [Salicibibacter halophilus]|uniref:Adenine deaminase n=1 Tax=Salicibibacter halophilus TaxID=2502791 RepID=A0A514LH00_9BACI|nr:adenine deaminase [Salicibibacter halophilus]QDI91124.1 adenine deaminase [Salicibibacter halophilus]